jgi:hypothetical protein
VGGASWCACCCAEAYEKGDEEEEISHGLIVGTSRLIMVLYTYRDTVAISAGDACMIHARTEPCVVLLLSKPQLFETTYLWLHTGEMSTMIRLCSQVMEADAD